MVTYGLMIGPEARPTIDDLLQNVAREESYDARFVGSGIREVYKSGEYDFLQIPIGTRLGTRTLDALHLAAFNPSETVELLEFFPDTTIEEEETLKRLIREQLEAFDIEREIDEDHLKFAPLMLREQGLHVLGGFQLGTLSNGKRTTEIIYPKIFAKITESVLTGAYLSALYVRYVQ